jgi:hypothetical protein
MQIHYFLLNQLAQNCFGLVGFAGFFILLMKGDGEGDVHLEGWLCDSFGYGAEKGAPGAGGSYRNGICTWL